MLSFQKHQRLNIPFQHFSPDTKIYFFFTVATFSDSKTELIQLVKQHVVGPIITGTISKQKSHVFVSRAVNNIHYQFICSLFLSL